MSGRGWPPWPVEPVVAAQSSAAVTRTSVAGSDYFVRVCGASGGTA
jgi:hypothetical protein